jgi:ATP-dependent exoDNAse (exonuclease V) beta subunit
MPVSDHLSTTSLPGLLMPAPEIDLLAIDHGTITAPAGCGKTHLVADALTRHTAAKPILILTHTNAGVVALRGRLDRALALAKLPVDQREGSFSSALPDTLL